MNLCLTCHDRPQTTPQGQRLADMAALLKDNPDHHGPVRRADCVACHNPHASPNFRLLAKEYPDMFYAPFDLQNYDLCFTCHLPEMVTMDHGVGVTGFRQGDLNLHYVHVHKEQKGRTCRACHEVHASKRPFHIREKVPFGTGGWEMEINFEVQPDGGRCAPGCHEEKSYRRGESAEAGRSVVGQVVKENAG
jgi:predicted CXXCH cytochrome family protein